MVVRHYQVPALVHYRRRCCRRRYQVPLEEELVDQVSLGHQEDRLFDAAPKVGTEDPEQDHPEEVMEEHPEEDLEEETEIHSGPEVATKVVDH